MNMGSTTHSGFGGGFQQFPEVLGRLPRKVPGAGCWKVWLVAGRFQEGLQQARSRCLGGQVLRPPLFLLGTIQRSLPEYFSN